MKPYLKLTFCSGDGEDYSMCVNLERDVADKLRRISPPRDHSVPWLPGHVYLDPFETVVEILQTRTLRGDLFQYQARRLGTLLAERMCDAEGWHDASRIEPAKRQLKTGEPHQ